MDVVLIAFLTLLNGAFAMSELALASSKKARLQALAEAGDGGAQAALRLLAHPTQFLSSVQVGITSIGMLNGIVGEAAFSDDLSLVLQRWGVADATASITATAVVVVVITFVTIVFGELVPKRIGQLYSETVARHVSRPMESVSYTHLDVYKRQAQYDLQKMQRAGGLKAVGMRRNPPHRMETYRAPRHRRMAVTAEIRPGLRDLDRLVERHIRPFGRQPPAAGGRNAAARRHRCLLYTSRCV